MFKRENWILLLSSLVIFLFGVYSLYTGAVQGRGQGTPLAEAPVHFYIMVAIKLGIGVAGFGYAFYISRPKASTNESET